MTYMYRAALYCDDCGEKIIADLRGTNREDTGDTDDFPQGCDPFSTESDTPHHCDGCDGFLGNELTSDGCDYVRDEIIEDFAAGRMDSVAITTWLPFYGRKQLGLPDLEDVEVACAEAHAELARHGVPRPHRRTARPRAGRARFAGSAPSSSRDAGGTVPTKFRKEGRPHDAHSS